MPVARGFTPGSLVTMADGTLKPIERMAKGDSVLSGSGAPDAVQSVYKYRYVGDLQIIHPKGSPEPLEAHPFQKVFNLGGESWRATCNKWLWPSTEANLVNSLDFRHEIKLNPTPTIAVETGDRLVRVMYSTVARNEGLPHNDAAFLIGVYAARGHSDRENLVLKFRANDVYSLERVERMLNSWHVVHKIKQDDESKTINVIMNCDWLIKWLRMYVLESGTERTLTPAMMTMDQDQQLEFLSGYFGDHTELYRGERSLKLVSQVQMIMDRNRLHSTTHKGFAVSTKEGIRKHTYNLRTTPFYAQKIATAPEIAENIKVPKKSHNFCRFIGNKVFVPTGKILDVAYNDYLYFLGLDIEKSYIVNGIAVST